MMPATRNGARNGLRAGALEDARAAAAQLETPDHLARLALEAAVRLHVPPLWVDAPVAPHLEDLPDPHRCDHCGGWLLPGQSCRTCRVSRAAFG